MASEAKAVGALSGEPEIAYTTTTDGRGWIVVLATENEAGYRPLTYGPYADEERAKAVARNLNARLGMSEPRACLVVLSSMCPLPPSQHAKRRANWDVLERRAIERKSVGARTR